VLRTELRFASFPLSTRTQSSHSSQLHVVRMKNFNLDAISRSMLQFRSRVDLNLSVGRQPQVDYRRFSWRTVEFSGHSLRLTPYQPEMIAMHCFGAPELRGTLMTNVPSDLFGTRSQ